MISNELLRRKIIDSAIHGTLIENDLELKPVNLDSIKENIPFEIPLNWKWCLIKNVATCKTGNSINENEKREKYSNTDCDGLLYIATKDVEQSNNINYMNGIKIPNSLLEKFKIAKKNSTLICIEGGSAGKKVGFIDQDVCYVNKLCNIISETINNKYIYYFVQSSLFLSEFELKKTGIIGGVSVKNLEHLLIPVPPIEEQEKIVEKIDELFRLLDTKEKNDKEKENLRILLKQKIMDSAIRGDLVKNEYNLEPVKVPKIKCDIPFEIPSNWVWTNLKDISDYGNNKKKNGKDIENNEWILELEDIEKDTGRIIKKVFQKERKAVSDKNIFKENDVLYGKLRPYLNKCIIVHESGYCSTEIEPITLIDCVLPEYLHIVLTSKYFLNYVNSCSYGAKMPRLGTKDGQNAKIPLPPLEEQKRIVEKKEKLFALIEQL